MSQENDVLIADGVDQLAIDDALIAGVKEYNTVKKSVQSDIILDDGFDRSAVVQGRVTERMVGQKHLAMFHGEVAHSGQPGFFLRNVQSAALNSQRLSEKMTCNVLYINIYKNKHSTQTRIVIS